MMNRLWVHALCVIAAVAVPAATTLSATSNNSPHSDEHDAQIVAPTTAPALVKMLTAADIAVPFLRQSYIEGNSGGAYERFASPDFIQHNPEMENGLAARLAFFAKRDREHPGAYPSPRTWANVVDRIVIDGDMFAVHHHVFMSATDPGRVFVDMWRVANGLIVEHWDVIQAVPTSARNANTMWCGKGSSYAEALTLGDTVTHPTCGSPDAHAAKTDTLATVNAYLAQMTSGDVAAALRQWLAPNFRQHSPNIPDGIAGTLDYLNGEFVRRSDAEPRNFVSRVLVQGDLVFIHHHVVPPGSGLGRVQVDIFRVADGKINEHWDVKQAVTEPTASGNTIW